VVAASWSPRATRRWSSPAPVVMAGPLFPDPLTLDGGGGLTGPDGGSSGFDGGGTNGNGGSGGFANGGGGGGFLSAGGGVNGGGTTDAGVLLPSVSARARLAVRFSCQVVAIRRWKPQHPAV
jgi:hypothetical protein